MNYISVKNTLSIIFLSSCFLQYGCKKYNVSTVSESDNGIISYQTRVQPIIENHCIGCHDASYDLALTDYEHLVTYAKSGQLRGSLTGNPDYLQMPAYDSLTPSEISTILQWIDQEYPE